MREMMAFARAHAHTHTCIHANPGFPDSTFMDRLCFLREDIFRELVLGRLTLERLVLWEEQS